MNIQSIETGDIFGVMLRDSATISTVDIEVNAVCFARGTLIEIANNCQIPVEDLRRVIGS